MLPTKPKIALILGGMSSESAVSRQTGKSFEKALIELNADYFVLEADESLPQKLVERRPDIALLAVHGKYAEDGTIQGICEYLKIPYSGSGVMSSAMCMDKIMTKKILQQSGIPTAKFWVLDTRKSERLPEISYPVAVKPARDGSSVAISFAQNETELLKSIKLAESKDHLILIEQFIAGTEVTVPIFCDEALPIIEIAPKSGFYNYENKYTAGKTDYIIPARLLEPMYKRCEQIALEASRALRTRTYCRVDLMIDKTSGPMILEINTLPGSTETSLLPKSAAHKGIPFKKVIQTLIERATLDYAGLT